MTTVFFLTKEALRLHSKEQNWIIEITGTAVLEKMQREITRLEIAYEGNRKLPGDRDMIDLTNRVFMLTQAQDKLEKELRQLDAVLRQLEAAGSQAPSLEVVNKVIRSMHTKRELDQQLSKIHEEFAAKKRAGEVIVDEDKKAIAAADSKNHSSYNPLRILKGWTQRSTKKPLVSLKRMLEQDQIVEKKIDILLSKAQNNDEEKLTCLDQAKAESAQIIHLRRRAEYLIKILRSALETAQTDS